MVITVKTNAGRDFGTDGVMTIGTIVFTSQVAFDEFVTTLQSFDAEDEIFSVNFDCR